MCRDARVDDEIAKPLLLENVAGEFGAEECTVDYEKSAVHASNISTVQSTLTVDGNQVSVLLNALFQNRL